MKQIHSQLKQKLSNLNDELNEIINKNFGKIKKTIKEKEENTSKIDIEAQKGEKKLNYLKKKNFSRHLEKENRKYKISCDKCPSRILCYKSSKE